jgi:hypothetical protein
MLYGMVRSLGSFLLSSVFVFYNYVSVKNLYGVGLEVMLPVTLGYVAVAVVAQICAMAIYVKRNGDGTSAGLYESVLESTEKIHSVISAAKESTVREVIPRNVRLGKTGLGRGEGSSAFYYKHKLENRRSRLLVFGIWGVVSICVTLAFAFVMSNASSGAIGGAIGGAIAIGAYVQMFAVMLGRINLELSKPFVYLVPEPPFRKLLHCLRESLKTYALDAVIVGAGVMLILRVDLVTCILFACVRLSFSLVYVGANCLLRRIWGDASNGIAAMALYGAIVLVMLVPALTLALVIGLGILKSVVFLPIGQTILFFIAACNVLCAAIAVYLAKDMLPSA